MIEREHPRFAHHAEISIVLFGALVSGHTVNVSRGGLCALLDVAVTVGTELDVQLALCFEEGVQSESLRLRCRAVWCTPIKERYQVGFSFVRLLPEAQRDVELFMRFLDQRVAPSRV